MRKTPAPQRMARRLVAGAAAFLLALQALVLIGAAFSRVDATPGSGVFETRCAGGARDDAPITRHGAEDHCLQCVSREEPPLAIAPATTPVFIPHCVQGPVRPRETRSPRAPPLGWASTWSARAPPSRS